MLKMVIVEDENIIRKELVSYLNREELEYEIVGEGRTGKEELKLILDKQPDFISHGYL